MYSYLLRNRNLIGVSQRYVSSNFIRPHPRPYRRRLFEQTLAPILPKEMEKEWKELNDPFNIHATTPEVSYEEVCISYIKFKIQQVKYKYLVFSL